MKFALLNYTIRWVLVDSQSFKIICCWAPKLCLTICHHMDCRTSGSSVLLSLGVCSNSCPLSSWCHATISCSATFFCLQPFPGSGSFPMSWLFTLGRQILELQLNSFFNEYSRLLSFRMDWFHLTAVQGTLKNLLQHHNSKASILSAQLLTVQLSHPNMTTGETIALTRQTFTSKEMSLLYNMLSRLVIAFLSKRKHPLTSWLQSQSEVILEPKKIKSVTLSTFFLSICH